jgi:hypothetical protein
MNSPHTSMNRRLAMTRRLLAIAVLFSLAPLMALAQDPADAPEPQPADRGFRLGGEIKLAFRDSEAVETPTFFPFPPTFIPPGETAVFQRTPLAGRSLEVPNLALIGEGELTPGVAVKAELHFLDLYNRNPTSSDDRFLLREAWVRFGRRPAPLEFSDGSSFYVLAGLAPRFTKQVNRRLESYGLWATAVGRFEQPQLEVGGSFGRNVYFRALVGNGNPVFFRDPNALAGDNGAPERVPPAAAQVYQSGFPILYDAKAADLNPTGRFEWGGGLGVRLGDDDGAAVDVIGWYFARKMEDEARIRGSIYQGDLELLRGVVFPLPFSGDDKSEWGANLEARLGGLRVFAQYVDQEIAELPRSGFELELAYRFGLDGLFVVGETPIGEWIQPVVRYSSIDNEFTAPREFPGPSVAWDWNKLDVGIRIGITRNIDVTVEYARNTAKRAAGNIHPDETLVTLRTGF